MHAHVHGCCMRARSASSARVLRAVSFAPWLLRTLGARAACCSCRRRHCRCVVIDDGAPAGVGGGGGSRSMLPQRVLLFVRDEQQGRTDKRFLDYVAYFRDELPGCAHGHLICQLISRQHMALISGSGSLNNLWCWEQLAVAGA